MVDFKIYFLVFNVGLVSPPRKYDSHLLSLDYFIYLITKNYIIFLVIAFLFQGFIT